MSGKIKILDELLASKIAAGEVVERPSSVVKELMENSLDAGASEISITLAEGGKRLIRVVDNGTGMSAEDAGVSFLRHATSKVMTETDLEAIKTLGFRGEALASISTVSRVTLKTRERGEVEGTSVVIEGGGEPSVSACGCPEGTSIEVRDLFYNTPARLKFLRSAGSEFGRIAEVVKRAALINPDKRFRLVHGSTKAIDTHPGTLRGRIAEVFGREKADKLIEINDPFITGFIGGVELTFSTGRELYVFINGRPIRDKSVSRAIIDAYGTIIDRGRFPFAVLDLKLPREDVDVNIHPAKEEVRFKNTGFVFDMVKAVLREAITRGTTTPDATWLKDPAYTTGDVPEAALSQLNRSLSETSSPYPAPTTANSARAESRGERVLEFGPRTSADAGGAWVRNPEFMRLETVGQLWGEFLVAESPGGDPNAGFFIIDQHGAEERGAFERLKKGLRTDGIKSQLLLLPERVDTTPEERDSLTTALEDLKRLGFEITPFGPSGRLGGETFLVKSVPDVLAAKGLRVAGLVKDIAGELASVGGSSRAEESIEASLMRIACHSVIRGRRMLKKEEGDALLRKLATIDFAGHCPHGRPVVKRFSRKELEAMFKRG